MKDESSKNMRIIFQNKTKLYRYLSLLPGANIRGTSMVLQSMLREAKKNKVLLLISIILSWEKEY